MTLGLASGTVEVVAYDHTWPSLYATEAARLYQCFVDGGLEATIEHTGSTAVPNLSAKPILDILVGHDARVVPTRHIEVLQLAGYDHRGQQGIAGREFFRRGVPRSHHIHLVAIGGGFWTDHLTFRDRLRGDPSLRDAYASLKRALAATYPHDREAYIAGKSDFVRRVLA